MRSRTKRGAPLNHRQGVTALKLTRETILDGSLRAASQALLGSGMRYMTDEECSQQIRQMLACAPRRDRIWVFGYGSLMWNPALHFVERRPARIFGFHRRFCLRSRAGRGSPERPGLMLALERGGSCHGVAYRIARTKVESELDVVWRREMMSRAYHPVWVPARTAQGIEHAIAFAANRTHERYVRDLDERSVVQLLAHGAGHLGQCCDYLFRTVAHLQELGIRDRRLEALAAQVRTVARG